jgi:flagellar biosynthetic protein FlhB
VALRYRQPEDRAPVVVAKGQDYLAQRIKKQAKGPYLRCGEQGGGARAVCSGEVGDEIPPSSISRIADILIYVLQDRRDEMTGGGT